MTASIVVGGAGFIGSHLVDALVKRGESVVVIDDLQTGRLGNLESAISSGRVTFVYFDIAAAGTALGDVLRSTGARKFDCLYYCQGLPEPDESDESAKAGHETTQKRERTLAAMLDLAAAFGARVVLALPSAAMFEAEEAQLATVAHERGLDARAIHLPRCYGPRASVDDDQVVAPLLAAAASGRPLPMVAANGRQRVAVMFVGDVIAALLRAADRRLPDGEVTSIRAHDAVPLIEIAQAAARAVGVKLGAEYGALETEHVPSVRSDQESAGRSITVGGTPLDAGLRLTYGWFTKESRLFV